MGDEVQPDDRQQSTLPERAPVWRAGIDHAEHGSKLQQQNEASCQPVDERRADIFIVARIFPREPQDRANERKSARCGCDPGFAKPSSLLPFRFLPMRQCECGQKGGHGGSQDDKFHREAHKAHSGKNGPQPAIEMAIIAEGEDCARGQDEPQKPNDRTSYSQQSQQCEDKNANTEVIRRGPALRRLQENTQGRLRHTKQRDKEVRPSPTGHAP